VGLITVLTYFQSSAYAHKEIIISEKSKLYERAVTI
jgi:hypothetical protein